MDLWHKKMTQVVGMVLDRLGTTLIAWDVFQKSHIGYFLHDGSSDPSHLQAHSPRQPDSLRAIEEAFRGLWAIQQKVELLRQSLKIIGEEASYWLCFVQTSQTLRRRLAEQTPSHREPQCRTHLAKSGRAHAPTDLGHNCEFIVPQRWRLEACTDRICV